MANLSKITVLLKTLLRDAYLFEAVAGIRATMPEVKILVVDDSDVLCVKKYEWIHRECEAGLQYVKCPFDSGFGYKSNRAIEHMGIMEQEYLLIGSDDFDFRPPSVREGIEKLVDVLEGDPTLAIASGWVNGVSYDYFIDEVEPGHFEEVPFERRPSAMRYSGGWPCYPIELTVNYCLVRKSILGWGERQVHWNNSVKIGGGEHGAFFLDVKRAGHKVVHVPGVHIREQGCKTIDPRYGRMRRRAHDKARPCFVERGVLRWGSDYCAPGIIPPWDRK